MANFRLFTTIAFFTWFFVGSNLDARGQIGEAPDYLRDIRQVVRKARVPTTLRIIGKSSNGREIPVLEFRHPIKTTQKRVLEPIRIFVNALHHGNERMSYEVAMALAHNLALHGPPYGTEIVIGPVINPDGFILGTRSDSKGRDPNRDYDYPGRTTESVFQLPETDAVRSYLSDKKFQGAIALHAGMEGVLWPWCYSPLPAAQATAFRRIGLAVARAMDAPVFKQSWQDYPTRGEFTDYAFMTYGTLAVTLEVSSALKQVGVAKSQTIGKSMSGIFAYIRELKALHELGVQTYSLEPQWGPWERLQIIARNLKVAAAH